MLIVTLLATVWLSFYTTTVSSQEVSPPDCTDKVPKGCVCSVSDQKAVSLTCDSVNLTEIPDLSVIGFPVEHL